MKAEIVRKVVEPIVARLCESWTANERQRSKMNSTEMRFQRRIKNKTRLDKIRNEVHRDEVKVESIEVTIKMARTCYKNGRRKRG